MKFLFGLRQRDDLWGRRSPKDQSALEAEIQKYRAVTRGSGNLHGLALAQSQEHLGDLLYELGTWTKDEAHFTESQEAYTAALSVLLIIELGSLNF